MFASKPTSLLVPVGGTAAHVRTETLTRSSAIEARGAVSVRGHRARLTLAPNTVVAVVTR